MITVEVKKQQEEKPKDIFYNNNYVISKDGCIVHVSGENNQMNACFCGQSIKSVNTSVKEGTHSDTWVKSAFTQFAGTITITSK